MLSIVITTALGLSSGYLSYSEQTLTSKVNQMISKSIEDSRVSPSSSDKQKIFISSYKKIEALVNDSVMKTEITEEDLAQAGVHQIVALSLTELIPQKTDLGFTQLSCTSALSTLNKAHSDATKKEPALIQIREQVQKFIQSECDN